MGPPQDGDGCAGVSCWVFGANLRIVISSIMRRRNGLMASSVMGMLLSCECCEPLILRQDVPLRYRVGCVASRSKLPHESFSPFARLSHAECIEPCPSLRA